MYFATFLNICLTKSLMISFSDLKRRTSEKEKLASIVMKLEQENSSSQSDMLGKFSSIISDKIERKFEVVLESQLRADHKGI